MKFKTHNDDEVENEISNCETVKLTNLKQTQTVTFKRICNEHSQGIILFY